MYVCNAEWRVEVKIVARNTSTTRAVRPSGPAPIPFLIPTFKNDPSLRTMPRPLQSVQAYELKLASRAHAATLPGLPQNRHDCFTLICGSEGQVICTISSLQTSRALHFPRSALVKGLPLYVKKHRSYTFEPLLAEYANVDSCVWGTSAYRNYVTSPEISDPVSSLTTDLC